MPLEEYKKKRDFRRTPEPERGESEEPAGIFVVQEHHASHLHYDFRLSLDGVLKSWAVPKGIPEVSKIRRLAVETEDHPIEYASFEGEIPKGQYGAGKVVIWDRGDFELVERSENKIIARLNGKRLSGVYVLVRFAGREKNDKNWLVMKTADSKGKKDVTRKI